tara:strand:- start:13451 stop:14683 length:1233 start_codon:yes stop_codon:yes gene_type:complete
VTPILDRLGDTISGHTILDVKQFNSIEDFRRDLIIADYGSFQLLETENVDIDSYKKIFLIGEVETEEDDNLVYINQKHLLTSITQYVSDFLENGLAKVEYIKFKLEKLLVDLPLPCNLLILKSRDKFSEFKLAGEKLSTETIKKLESKTINSVFIKNEDFPKMMEFLNKNREISDIFDEKILIDTVAALHEFVIEMGFDERIVKLIKNLHKNIENQYTDKDIRRLLARFKGTQGSFIYNHSFLTSMIALSVGENFSWMNYENREKIYLASILHDLGFRKKENAFKEYLGKEKIGQLPQEDQDDILAHPSRFSKILENSKNIHPDVIKMIELHHGLDGENSYPKMVNESEINPLILLFVISHEFSVGLYKQNFNAAKVPSLINGLKLRFKEGKYKTLLGNFETTINTIFLA